MIDKLMLNSSFKVKEPENRGDLNTFDLSARIEENYQNIASGDRSHFYKIAVGKDSVNFLDHHFVGSDNIDSLEPLFKKSLLTLKYYYEEANLRPTFSGSFSVSIDDYWDAYKADTINREKFFLDQQLNNSHSGARQSNLSDMVDTITKYSDDQPAGGFLTNKCPSQIKEGISKYFLESYHSNDYLFGVEADDLIQPDQPSEKRGNFLAKGVLRFHEEETKSHRNKRTIRGLLNNGLTFSIMHLSSGVTDLGQAKKNFIILKNELTKGDSIVAGDINIDVSAKNRFNNLENLYVLSQNTGYNIFIPKDRYSKIRGGNNQQIKKEFPIEAESNIILVKKDIDCTPIDRTYHLVMADNKKFNLPKDVKSIEIFSDDLPVDHLPVRVNINGQNYQLDNYVSTQDEKWGFRDSNYSQLEIMKSHIIHSSLKHAIIEQLKSEIQG